jgi:hypothetical protein
MVFAVRQSSVLDTCLLIPVTCTWKRVEQKLCSIGKTWYNIFANYVTGRVPVVKNLISVYNHLAPLGYYLSRSWRLAIGSPAGFLFGEDIMSRKITTEIFIKEAQQIHGNKYDYSLKD